jgi:hypothetical protein
MSTKRHRKQGNSIGHATDSRVVVRCRRCGAPLTYPLARLTDRSLLSGNDGEPYLPRGWFTVSNGDWSGPRGQLIANLGDRTFTAHHPDGRRLNGCCGLDGLDGRNTVCYEGHEVGTEKSDCWMSHALLFDPECVTLCQQEDPLSALAVPAWLTWQGGLIPTLGRAIQSEHRLADLPILADALEEAGCTDEAILNHCRQPGDHVKGCWALELICGRK